jgi:hypothetical protein
MYNYSQNKSSDGLTSYNSNYLGLNSTVYNGLGGVDARANLMEGVRGNVQQLSNGASSNTIGTGRGVYGVVQTYGSGVISSAIGIQGDISAGNNSITGNITTAFGAYTGIVSNTAMTIGTGYLYYGVHAGATTTTKYGLYLTNEANNYLSGNLVVAGTVNATSGLMTSYANVTGQVNTATLYATTSANVGANVQLTTSLLFIGNSTVNADMTSSLVQVTNSTSTANLIATGLQTYTNSTVNSTISASFIQVSNSTATSNLTASQLSMGANVFLNTTTLDVGNTVITTTNAVFGGTIAANGGIGTAGHGLLSGGAANAYWSTVVTSVASGNGITGGTITQTGTLYVDGANGISVDASGVNVLANSGIVANTTGVHVNTAYIATLSANNASFLGGTAASSYDKFPSGTRLLFQQTAAPTGWTKDTTHNDKALRVSNGAVTTGGNVAFTTAFASQSVTGTIANTTATGTIVSNATGITIANTTATGTVNANTVAGSAVSSTTGITINDHILNANRTGPHKHFVAADVTNTTGTPVANSTNQVTRVRDISTNSPNYNLLGTGTAATVGLTSESGGGVGHAHGTTDPGHTHTLTGTSHGHSFTGSTHGHTLTDSGHSHTFTGSTHGHTFTGTAINIAVQYVDIIIAQKD